VVVQVSVELPPMAGRAVMVTTPYTLPQMPEPPPVVAVEGPPKMAEEGPGPPAAAASGAGKGDKYMKYAIVNPENTVINVAEAETALAENWIPGTTAAIGDIWDGNAFIRPPEPPAPIPQTVSRFQARAALHLTGMLTAVEAIMLDPNTDMLAKLAWQDAQEFKRTSPTVLTMSQIIGLTDEQLDDLFILAATIDA